MISKKNKLMKIITIIINVLFCIMLPISAVAAMVSPMMFDSPQSTESLVTWTAFYASLTAPVVILASVITSFILLFKFKKYRAALIFSVIPFINIVILFTIIYISSLSR